VLWLHDCLSIWKSVYFLGHASTTAIILMGVVMPPLKPRGALKAKAGRAVGGSGEKSDGPIATVPAVPAVPSEAAAAFADKKVL
jgi:hypothetical protein